MADANGGADPSNVPIKYETPYHAEQANMFSNPPSQKRQRSTSQDAAEKRQRIEPAPAMDDDFARILAQATSLVTQQLQQSSDVQIPQPVQTEPLQNIPNQITNHQEPTNGAYHTSRFMSDPNLYMRILSLPILESLSIQILSTLAQGPYHETLKIVTDADCELGQAYATLKSLFDQTKKIYSQQAPFLSADQLNIKDPKHRFTIRTTNMATFAASTFGGQDVGFYELNDHFIATFTSENEPLGVEAGQLYVNLKTQMYLSASQQEEQDSTKEDILEDLFPLDLERTLSNRRPGQSLAPSEVSFIQDCNARREYLMAEPSDVESLVKLGDKYAWEDFLRSLSAHLNKAYEPLLAPYMKRHALTAPTSPLQGSNRDFVGMQSKVPAQSIENDFAAQAGRAVQSTLQGLGYAQTNNNAPSQPFQTSSQMTSNGYNTSSSSQYNNSNLPFPSQSAPTQILYEKARQAAVSKTNPGKSGRPGVASQRRPWSTVEENALMAGLDAVRGPHWSQILNLYGPEGTVSNILKDRNQVQLKDKARNLKLFFLKSNIEVPYYLQSVTGELKTRAPSQAARREAEERQRLQGDEDTAHFEGLLTLASGMQPNIQNNGETGGSQPGSHKSNSPEAFQVVELNQPTLYGYTPSQANEDERLRQTLTEATAALGTSLANSQNNGTSQIMGNNQLSI
ncbi:telomere repeat binding factor-domain-containing protein [Halenospora varia]|nr:telomere repeat binding factor-domain-containing protein [Halenospora varia]